MAFCSKCGAQINDGAQFCPKCGQPTNAVSQQQVYQQQYVAQPQEEEHSRMYKMWHSKWNWIGAIVFLIIIVAANTCGGSTSDIEKTTKEIMVERFKKEGVNLVVKSLNLVHKSGNEYSGIAECTVNGEDAQFSLKVLSDGQTVQAEWELSDIGSVDSGSDEEESSVSSSQANEVAKEGYNDGYQMGFQMADIDSEPDAKVSFTVTYGAPSTAEEKQMYNIYKENYERGYREGKRAGRE